MVPETCLPGAATRQNPGAQQARSPMTLAAMSTIHSAILGGRCLGMAFTPRTRMAAFGTLARAKKSRPDSMFQLSSTPAHPRTHAKSHQVTISLNSHVLQHRSPPNPPLLKLNSTRTGATAKSYPKSLSTRQGFHRGCRLGVPAEQIMGIQQPAPVFSPCWGPTHQDPSPLPLTL